MSRYEIEGKTFDAAFGVDHVTSAFVQIWQRPSDDYDRAVVIVDSLGVRIDPDQGAVLPPGAKRYLEELKSRIEKEGRKVSIDHVVVTDLLRIIGGFPDISMQVFEAFD